MDEIVETLDLRGKVCPYPTLNTSVALRRIAPGQAIELITDYYPTRQTIPKLADDLGCTWKLTEEDGVLHFVITKGAPDANP